MANNSPTLYCCCIADQPPRFTSANSTIVPVLGGAALCSDAEKYKKMGWELDDEGQNLSMLNDIFGDLTVLYWAWKNKNDSHLGVCQYRRPWNDDEVGNSEEDVLYVPPPAVFGSVRRQYEDCHSIFPAYQISMDLANRGRIPLTPEMVDYTWNQHLFHGCNMARGPKYLFDKYVSLVFETMVPFYIENNQLCQSLQGYQRRSIAFTAERMITALLLHRDHFFGHGKVKEANIGFIG